MAKYDAFGRRIGEDTLAEAGWRTPGAATTVEVAAEPPSPELPDPAVDGLPPGTRRRRRGTPRAAVLFLFAFFAVVGVGVLMVFNAVVESFEDGMGVDAPAGDTVRLQPPEQVAVPEEPAEGLEPGSLLREDRLGSALTRLRHGGGRALMLRLAPDRIDSQLRHGRGMRMVQIGADGELREIARAPVAGGVHDIDLAHVDPAAPERLLRSAQRRFGLSPARVDYLVLLSFGDEPTWNAFYRHDGAHVQARLDGRITRRVS